MPVVLAESTPLVEAAPGASTARRFRARLIQGGIQGSSGFYPVETLRRDGGTVFPKGTACFLDHPSLSEAADRPERSVKDLAGHLVTDAVYEGDGLYAEVEVFPHWAPVIEGMASSIGMSIRAYGTAEPSSDDNVRGPIITALTEGISVDFVTAAGAGGKLVALIESARNAVVEAVSDKPWSGFKAGDYDIGQWRKACLIGPDKPSESKGDYKLPVLEPDGTLNRNAVHAAASALAGGRAGVTASPEAKKTAAKTLVRMYGQLKEKPPFTLVRLAGSAQESAVPIVEARNVGQWLESRLHLSFTQLADDMFGNGRLSRDERIALSSAIGDGLAAFTTRVEADQPQLYQRDLWDGPADDDAELAETAEPAEPTDPPDVDPVIENAPGSPPADPTIKEGSMPELTEEQARQLEEAATIRTQLEEAQKQLAEATTKAAESAAVADRVTSLEQMLAEAGARNLRLENDRAARTVCAEALKTAGLPDLAHSKVIESVCRDLPTLEDGGLDGAKLAEAVTKAIDGEKAYVAALAEAAGHGAPRGLGAPAQLTEVDIDAELEKAFIGIGLDATAAHTAAVGR